MPGRQEAFAATELLNKSDPTLLTWKEVQEIWGSCYNFFISYGLKPWDGEDCEKARSISRDLKNFKKGESGDVCSVRVCKSGVGCDDPSNLIKCYDEVKEELTCPICYEFMEVPLCTTCCKNIVCESCPSHLQGSRFCPFCRCEGVSFYKEKPVVRLASKAHSLLDALRPIMTKLEAEEKKRKKVQEERRKKEEEERRKREEEKRKREEEKKRKIEEEQRKRVEEAKRKMEEEKRKKEEEEERRKKEEEKRKKEEEKKRKIEQEKKKEQERRKKEQQIKSERGNVWTSWIGQENYDYLSSWVSKPGELKSFCFLNNGCIFLTHDGTPAWRGLPDGRLKSLLNGRGRGMTKQVDLLTVVQRENGELYYFVRFMDSREYWSIPKSEQELTNFLMKKQISKVTFGLTSPGLTYPFPKKFQYAVESKRGETMWNINSIHDSWFEDGWDVCTLGSNGEVFVRDGREVVHTRFRDHQWEEVKGLRRRVKRAFMSEGKLLFCYN